MKKIFFLMILTIQLFAVGGLSIIEKDERDLLNKVLDEVNLSKLSDEKKHEIYETFEFALKKDWYTKWITNKTPSISKVANSKTQLVDMMLVDENRIYNITFINFSENKQLFISIKQYVSSLTKTVLNVNKEFQNNKDLKRTVDKENYAVYSETGYMNDKIIYVDGTTGMISYTSLRVINY